MICTVILPAKAALTEKKAAEEIRLHLEKVADVTVTADKKQARGKRIVIAPIDPKMGIEEWQATTLWLRGASAQSLQRYIPHALRPARQSVRATARPTLLYYRGTPTPLSSTQSPDTTNAPHPMAAP